MTKFEAFFLVVLRLARDASARPFWAFFFLEIGFIPLCDVFIRFRRTFVNRQYGASKKCADVSLAAFRLDSLHHSRL